MMKKGTANRHDGRIRLAIGRRSVLKHTALGTLGIVSAPMIIGRANAATPIKIAQTEALTGPSSAYGLRCRDGALMAVEEINASGGFKDTKGTQYTLELTTEDMANDARQAVTLYRQHALNSDVIAQIGPANSVGYVPIVPLAGQLKLPLVGAAGAPVKRWTEWAYRVNPVSGTATPVLLEKVVTREHVKRLAVIYDQTQDAQAGDADACQKMKDKLGYEIVAFQAFNGGDQDFAPQLTTIKGAKPDAIYVASTTGDGIKVTSQIRAMGLKQPLLTGYGNFQDPLYWDGTNGGIKNCYTWTGRDYKNAQGAVADWLGRYAKRFKLEVTTYSSYGYDSVFCIVEAVKRASSTDRAKINEVLRSIDFMTPIGSHITFKNPPSGENQTPTVTILQITDRGTYTSL
jgi:branched-chain amino acid transport system substrate-binding protein